MYATCLRSLQRFPVAVEARDMPFRSAGSEFESPATRAAAGIQQSKSVHWQDREMWPGRSPLLTGVDVKDAPDPLQPAPGDPLKRGSGLAEHA